VTWEGDNNVLCLQTARFLLKALRAAAAGRPVGGSAAYLPAALRELGSARSAAACADDWARPEAQLAALAARATLLGVRADAALRVASGASAGASGADAPAPLEGAAWNHCTLESVALARAHCDLVLAQTFWERVGDLRGELSAATSAVLAQLAALFGAGLILAGAADLMEAGFMAPAQAADARAAHRALLRGLRPNAVALVDAFGLPDYALNSALGRADGDVYAALYAAAQGSPLNATPEGPAWEAVLRPAMAARGGGGGGGGPRARL